MDAVKIGALLHVPEKSMALSMQSFCRTQITNRNEISVYSGEIAQPEQVKSEVRKLAAAFPSVTSDFLIVLIDRLIDNQFTKERVRDAINHIIDTSPYQKPAIADIISFDRKVKLFTFKEIEAKCSPGYPAFEHHKRVIIQGKPKYIEL